MPDVALKPKMRLLTHIVVAYQTHKNGQNLQKLDDTCNFIHLSDADTVRLIEQLCKEGLVTKDTETSLLTPADKGIFESNRYLRVVEQKI